ncbi:MAG: tetratricopeptide repeat protein [Myxococcota bacterium]|nr:tetratricopeptide repeat protein [Myxococcota bacterium]
MLRRGDARGESGEEVEGDAGPARGGFEFRDLVHLRGVVGMLEDGVPLVRIRRSVARLREQVPELGDPLPNLRVHASGHIVVRHEDGLLAPGGQFVLDFNDGAQAGAIEEVGEDEPPAIAELRARPSAEEDEDNALIWFERGSERDSDPSTYDEAIAAYRRAIELEPRFADAHCNLGTLFYNRGDRDAARRAYEDVLEIDPNHLEASFNLGNLFEEEGRRETALHHYKTAVRADPFFPEAHLNLALLYEKLGLSRSAGDHWRRYLQLVPEGSWAELARDRLSPGNRPDATDED